MTFAFLLRDGTRHTVDAHSFDQYGRFLRFYWLDEDGGRRDVALLDHTLVVAVGPVT